MTFRCVIFAAVSSKPQVEKESIPSQIENARALIHRREWQEVADPLIVPGESRDIDFLHEAIAEIPALATLIELAKAQTIDLVIVRDYDRLARTRTLLVQLSAYLNRCRVQIYALNKPVEPVSPADLARVGAASMTSATIEAFAGLEAQREIERLRERRRFGMDGVAKKGLWKNARTPFGYTRERQTDSGDVIYLDVPEIVPEQAAIVRRIEDLCLAGQSARGVARTLNLGGVPSAHGAAWTSTAVWRILHNPFYSGWIVWGLKRRQKKLNEDGRFVSRPQHVDSYETLHVLYKHYPSLQDILLHRESLAADGVIIERGRHEPLRTEERQNEIDREMRARVAVGGRGTSIEAKRPRIFTGLIRCAKCGHSAIARANYQGRIYYQCPASRAGACDNNASVREDRAYAAIAEIIENLINQNAVDAYLANQNRDNTATLEATLRDTEAALRGVKTRRNRWDNAYENGVIDLAAYSQKLSDLDAEAERLAATLSTTQQRLEMCLDQSKRRERILACTMPPLSDENRAAIKTQMRALIDRIIIENGRIIEVVFI